jgi:hypothetical protein
MGRPGDTGKNITALFSDSSEKKEVGWTTKQFLLVLLNVWLLEDFNSPQLQVVKGQRKTLEINVNAVGSSL